MKPIILALIALLAVGAGDIRAALAGTSAMVSGAEARPEGNPGSDRDAQGCIGSAGYVWCARAAVRPVMGVGESQGLRGD